MLGKKNAALEDSEIRVPQRWGMRTSLGVPWGTQCNGVLRTAFLLFDLLPASRVLHTALTPCNVVLRTAFTPYAVRDP